MPRTCSLCLHPNRLQIDRALLNGTAFRLVSKQFGTSISALSRHRAHLATAIEQAAERKEINMGDNLLAELQQLKNRLRSGLTEAENQRSSAGIVAFSREYRQTLETYFSITEKMADRAAKADAKDNAMVVRIVHVGESSGVVGAPILCPHCGEKIPASDPPESTP